MSSGVPAHSAKEREKSEKPETILGKDNIAYMVNSTMSYFLSKDFKGLYDKGLSKEEIKSAYFDRLLKELNEDYEKAIRRMGLEAKNVESIRSPLTKLYVRSMPMAKRIEDSVG